MDINPKYKILRIRPDPPKRATRRAAIAPILQAYATWASVVGHPLALEARRELRAIRALYRAAQHHADLTRSAHANGNQTCSADWTIVEAVDRLERRAARSPRRTRP